MENDNESADLVEQPVDVQEDGTQQNEQPQERTYTQQEVDELLAGKQSEWEKDKDRAVSQAIKTHDAKQAKSIEDTIAERVKYELMDATEKAKYDQEQETLRQQQALTEKDDKIRELEDMLAQENKAKKLSALATKIATLGEIDAEVAVGLANSIYKDTDEETDTAFEALKGYLETAAVSVARGKVSNPTPNINLTKPVNDTKTWDDYSPYERTQLPQDVQQKLYEERFGKSK